MLKAATFIMLNEHACMHMTKMTLPLPKRSIDLIRFRVLDFSVLSFHRKFSDLFVTVVTLAFPLSVLLTHYKAGFRKTCSFF